VGGANRRSLSRFENLIMRLFLIEIVLLMSVTARLPDALANCFAWGNLVGQSSSVLPKPKFPDPSLWDPWGLAFLPGGAFVVADSYSDKSTIYDGAGNKLWELYIPAPPGSPHYYSAPTGVVANLNSATFVNPLTTHLAQFIYVTIDGTIVGWNTTVANAEIIVDNSAKMSVYYGLTIGNNSKGTFLYLTNFHTGAIDVYDTSFNPVPLGGGSISGNFTDPNLPAGYGPFNIANIRGNLFVTYAPEAGDGINFTFGRNKGYVDVFDTSGRLIRNVASKSHLNAPWGIAEAPINFGSFGGDILIGNFGDGTIGAYDPATVAYRGQLFDAATKKTMAIPGLWALMFGGGQAADPATLYFTARLSETMYSGGFGPITPQTPKQCATGGMPY
jgi:uncharacterized protein (TIGR03118 family)